MAKADQERKHAMRRCRERLGICLTDNDMHVLIKEIQENRAKFVERQSNRVTVWELLVQGHTVHVVYDKHTKQIVTFLWPEGSVLHERIQI